MGKTEQKLLEQFYGDSGQGVVVTTARLVEELKTQSVRRESNLRQIHRALGRLNVVPQPIDFEGFVDSIVDDCEREELLALVSRVRSCRMPISVVQCREVRLGRWVCVWNNLRGERHWVWWSQDDSEGENLTLAVECLIDWHRKPCCLLFDSSALELFESLKIQHGQRICEDGKQFAIVDDPAAVQ